jgi:hypothetical protein
MAEQKTAQQQVREQYKVAENAAQNTLRALNDLAATTTALTFDTVEKNLRYSQDARAQAERAALEAVASYRRMYEEGLKSWQGYVQGVSEIINRAANY